MCRNGVLCRAVVLSMLVVNMSSFVFASKRARDKTKMGAQIQTRFASAAGAVAAGAAATGIGAPVGAAAGGFALVKGAAGLVWWSVHLGVCIFDPPPGVDCPMNGPPGPPAIMDVRNETSGTSLLNPPSGAPPSTPLWIKGFGFTPEQPSATQIVVDGKFIPAVPFSDQEILAAMPFGDASSPRLLSLTVLVNGMASNTVQLQVLPPVPSTAPGSLFRRLITLETTFNQLLTMMNCELIATTKFVPEGQAQFLSACQNLVRSATDVLNSIAQIPPKLDMLQPSELAFFDSILAPQKVNLDLLETLIPEFEDADGNGIPNFLDVCDVNHDGHIDRSDINLIFGALNSPASLGDPRDADGNRIITVDDARSCVLQCTKPLCAP
jgi:hypothetical protein